MKGQGVTIKPGGSSSIPLDPQQAKKYERAKRLGKGMVINAHPHQVGMMGGNIESMFRDTGAYLRPVADAGMDRAIREIRGSGFEDVMRDTGAYLRPVADAAMDRAIREIGRGRKGRGAYEDFEARTRKKLEGVRLYNKKGELMKEGGVLKRRQRGQGVFDDIGRSFQQTFAPVADVFRPGGSGEQLGKEVAKELIYKGIPGTTGALAGAAGAALQPGNPLTPILFGVAGERAGEELAKEVGRQTGYGRGRGLMQDAFAMAKSKGKAMAKQAVSKAKTQVKEMVNQYLDLGEKEAMDRIGSGMNGRIKKIGGRMRRGRALLVA
jgi:hypothetical protein